MNRRLKFLIIQLAAIQAVFLVILLVGSSYYLRSHKEKLANAISINAKNNIINNDLRRVIEDSFRISGSEFIAYKYENSKRKKLFLMPTSETDRTFSEKRNNSYFYGVIEKTLYYEKGSPIGTFVFIYQKYEYGNFVFYLWLSLIVLSLPFFLLASKNVHKDIARDLELEKEKFFGQSAKKWAHDIKQLTEPMKLELNSIKFENPEAQILMRQSLNKIEQRVLGLLGHSEGFYESLKDFEDKENNKDFYLLSNEVKNIFDELRRRYRNYNKVNLDLNIDVACKGYGYFEKNEFFRAISNIVTNSVEAQQSNSENKIDIKVKVEGSFTGIIISDTGKGISKNNLSEVTKPNFTFGKKQGTGNGLFQVKSFIESIQGKFSIESVIGKGTKVSLLIPLLKIKSNKVIHIDDEELLRRAWKKYFQERGVTVYSFSSPTEFQKSKQTNLKNSIVFIDSYMGEEERGEDFAKKMFDEGLECIYLATNDASHFKVSNYPWIKEVMGKSAKSAFAKIVEGIN